MSETGGLVYEGVGRPEVVTPRLVDKVRERVVNRLKQNTGEIVEQKWMDAYQKTVDALDPGMRKKVAEKMRIVAVAASKTARVGSAVNDFVLRWGGLFDVVRGVHAVVRPNSVIDVANQSLESLNDPIFDRISDKARTRLTDKLTKAANMTARQMRVEGGKRAAKGLLEGVLGKARISRVAAGWMGDIAGSYGEKIAQITNKILRGKPKTVAG